MAITISIEGVDKSSLIDWTSVTIEQVASNQIDSAAFRISKYGSKTYTPSLDDAVLISDGATAIFGGTIVKVSNEAVGPLQYLSIECASYERYLDRYLVVKEITSKTPRYALNTIIADFVNRIYKDVDTAEVTETWTTEDGTVAANTTAGQFIYGSQARKFTATVSSTATARRESALDATTFADGTTVASSDLVKFFAYIEDAANVASIRVRFGGDAGATYTNYYEATISSGFVDGWQELTIAKSAFVATGAPDWATILKRQYRVTANASGSAVVSLDDVRFVQASTYFAQTGIQDADDITLGSVKFNYEQVSEAIRQIANVVGNDWYIDPTRVIYFHAPATMQAPFALTDTSLNFIWDSLKYSNDITTLRNQIFVRGGEYQGSTTDYEVIADGTALNYRSPYRIKNISVLVNGVSKTVGVDNLNDPASYDCLYSYQEKTLKFKTATKPAATHVVKMTGNPMIPVIVKKGDPVSIAQYGIYEVVIEDKSIITKEGARDRATAELRNYREALVEGEFVTDTTGLRAGQQVGINVTARGINETFLIQSLRFVCKSPTEFFYNAKIVTTRSFGIIEYLLGLLRNQRKQIVINENESIDLVQDFAETVNNADVWTFGEINLQTEQIDTSEVFNDELDHGTIFVYAPYDPANFADTKRPFILSGSPLGGAITPPSGDYYLLEDSSGSYIAENGDIFIQE